MVVRAALEPDDFTSETNSELTFRSVSHVGSARLTELSDIAGLTISSRTIGVRRLEKGGQIREMVRESPDYFGPIQTLSRKKPDTSRRRK
jgi:hypothetical protein